VSWYRRHLVLPNSLKGRRIFLDFDGVMMAAEVFVNGRRLAAHKGGYVPFSVDVTDHVGFGASKPNVVAVRVDSRERADIPPCGGGVDYLTFGGIYRDVRVRAVSPFFIEAVFAKPADVLTKAPRLDVAVTVGNLSAQARSGALALELLDAAGRTVARSEGTPVEAAPGRSVTVEMKLAGLRGIRLWDLENPHLYTAARRCARAARSWTPSRRGSASARPYSPHRVRSCSMAGRSSCAD